MKKILFATEFSDHAPTVFRYAAELAYYFNTDLLVMHAYNRPEITVKNEAEIDEIRKLIRENMERLVEEHLPKEYRTSVSVNFTIVDKPPVDAIRQTALQEDAGLIVIGLSGRTKALDRLFGSTSLQVISRADTPVLAVPADAEFQGIDKILYTTNFEFRDLGALNRLLEWNTALEAPIHCLHVVELLENELESVKNMNILKETYVGKGEMYFELAKGALPEKIKESVSNRKADILAMIAHKRGFFDRLISESKARQMAKDLKTPILVFKDNAYEIDPGLWGVVQVASSIG
jgi:nucleotide-binding universal stress UspA family protein